MIACGLTDRGLVRQINEDSIYCSTEPVGIYPNLFMVADGMGGHQAGDFASSFTVDYVHRFLESWEGDPAEGFHAAVIGANLILIKKGLEDPARSGMGTTLVMLSVWEDHYLALNVGDSRIYGVYDGKLRQITRDHSWVEEMLAIGCIEKDSELYHAKKNIITRAVGASKEIVPDLFEAALDEINGFLLCSDGLTNMLKDVEIEHILADQEDVLRTTGRLVSGANEAGGTDNISVILITPSKQRGEV